MPGYNVQFVSEGLGTGEHIPEKGNLLCIRCNLVLKEPLQLLEEGTRICKSCFEEKVVSGTG